MLIRIALYAAIYLASCTDLYGQQPCPPGTVCPPPAVERPAVHPVMPKTLSRFDDYLTVAFRTENLAVYENPSFHPPTFYAVPIVSWDDRNNPAGKNVLAQAIVRRVYQRGEPSQYLKLEWIEVAPEHQRKGIATEFLAGLEAFYKEKIQVTPTTADGKAWAESLDAPAATSPTSACPNPTCKCDPCYCEDCQCGTALPAAEVRRDPFVGKHQRAKWRPFKAIRNRACRRGRCG